MLDQVEALKWVNENIGAFGGEPDKVTIFGESAGATSVALHLLSPLSEGLFHRAISESGVDLSPWAVHKSSSAKRVTKRLALKCNCLGVWLGNSESIMNCLRNISAKELAKKGFSVLLENFVLHNDFAWSPVVDGQFLPDTPQALRNADGKLSHVKYMAGVNRNELSLFLLLLPKELIDINAGFNCSQYNLFLFLFASRLSGGKWGNIPLLKRALRSEYNTPLSETNPDTLRTAVIDMTTDYAFVAPTIAALSSHSKVEDSFMYLFSHVSALDKRPAWMTTIHGEELLYVFGGPFMEGNRGKYDDTDRNVSDFMITAWTNFAKTGNPSADGVTWSQFEASRAYLNIDGSSPKMGENYRKECVDWWNVDFPEIGDGKSARKRGQPLTARRRGLYPKKHLQHR